MIFLKFEFEINNEWYKNDPSNYFILLILTDGIITDMVETKQVEYRNTRLCASPPFQLLILSIFSICTK